MNIVLTGGGTGGHVVPHLSILEELKKHFDKIYYLGTNGIEKQIMAGKVDEFFEIDAYKMSRKNAFSNVFLPFKVARSVLKIRKILKKLDACVIFSKGGFVSVPVCLAGKMLNIPIVSHESDLTLGKANKLIYKLSKTLCTTFEKTANGLKKGVFTGSPIRKELFLGRKKRGYELSGFKGQRKIVLVTGGSTGAMDLNRVVANSVETLKNFDIIHLVGKGKRTKINAPNYFQMEYCSEIENLLAISDVVVSRAGSNTIYELLALNKPMLLVPLPKGNSRGDQVENAKYFEEMGYAKVIFQENLNTLSLADGVNFLVENKEKIEQRLSKIPKESLTNGAQNIVKEILKVVKK